MFQCLFGSNGSQQLPTLDSSSDSNGLHSSVFELSHSPSQQWRDNIPIRYYRFLDNKDEIVPIHERADESWSWKTFLSYAGPGFLVAIAYLDPGNLEANLQAGAYTKYQLVWVLLGTVMIGLILQGMAARVGIVTGKHLAQLCRQEYNAKRWVSLWIMSEISIVASDVQAVITSAIAFRILFSFPLWFGCIVTALDTIVFLSLHLLGIRSLESFFVAIVAVMSICFFWTFSLRLPDPMEVARGAIIPSIPSYGLATAVGIVGSLILPQNYYVHSAIVLTREVDRSNPVQVREANKYMLADAAVALFIAFVLNFCVISSFAELFFNKDCALASTTSACIADSENYHHDSHIYGECMTPDNGGGYCQHIGLSGADAALEGALGATAGFVWACGLLASAQSSTMTITYAGQFINDGFGQFHIPLYQRIALCRIAALVPSVLAATLEATHPSAMDDATQIGNIIASFCVPFSILPMLKFCCSSRLMGEHVMDKYQAYLIALVAVFLITLNATLLWEFAMKFSIVPYEVRAVLGIGSSLMYVYLNYLMVDEEMDDLLAGAWQSLRCCCCCCCGGDDREAGGASARRMLDDGFDQDQSGHSTAGLMSSAQR